MVQVLTDPGLLLPEEQEEQKKRDRDWWGAKWEILGKLACCFSCDKRDGNGRAQGLKLLWGLEHQAAAFTFSISWVAAAKQADFSGLWNSYHEPYPAHPPQQCPAQGICLLCLCLGSALFSWSERYFCFTLVQYSCFVHEMLGGGLLPWHWKTELAFGVERKN